MKIKPSIKPGHVLLDLDENGVRLLAAKLFPARPSCSTRASRVADCRKFSEELQQRADTPLKLTRSGSWRNFGINE